MNVLPQSFLPAARSSFPSQAITVKLHPINLTSVVRGTGNVHAAQPATVSLTQSCETGTVYQLDEIAALTDAARAHGLNVHMDGARFANGLISLNTSMAEMTWKSGIDVLSFGGTKNGCLAAEAVIFFKPELVQSFPFLHKRSGHLLSKMRFVSAQLEAYISNNVWLRNAQHANAMAARLSKGLAAIDGSSWRTLRSRMKSLLTCHEKQSTI